MTASPNPDMTPSDAPEPSSVFDTSEAPASQNDTFAPAAAEAGAEVGPSGPPPSAPSFDYDALARANAAYIQPVMQQFAPKPEQPRAPWQDPSHYNLRGYEGDQALAEYHRRHEMHAREVAKAEIAAEIKKVREEMGQALYGQTNYFNTLYKPEHAAYRQHLDGYLRQNIPEALAIRLAKQDAASAAPRAMPPVPKHATSPATRTTPPAAPGHKQVPLGEDGYSAREARMKQRAAAMGIQWSGVD